MAKVRNPRTPQELQKASKHLEYEIVMLFQTREIWERTFGTLSKAISDALMESFLIHFRCLLDFLYLGENVGKDLPQPKEDDILAEDFFENSELWREACPVKPELLRLAHVRSHKEVAHLTYNRLEQEGNIWQFRPLLEEIKSPLKLFLNEVPDNRVHFNLKAMLHNRWLN